MENAYRHKDWRTCHSGIQADVRGCVTEWRDQYVKRGRHAPEAQYASIKSALERTLGPLPYTVGSDYVLYQHILVVNSWTSHCLPSYQSLVTCLRVSIAQVCMIRKQKQTRKHFLKFLDFSRWGRRKNEKIYISLALCSASVWNNIGFRHVD
jgi:hypothetical protein